MGQQRQQRRGGLGFGGAFRRGGGARFVGLRDARGHREARRMVGPLGRDKAVDRKAEPPRLRPLLQPGFGVARRGGCLVDQRFPPAADKSGSLRQPGIEIDRSDHGLADIGEDARIARRARRRV